VGEWVRGRRGEDNSRAYAERVCSRGSDAARMGTLGAAAGEEQDGGEEETEGGGLGDGTHVGKRTGR